MDRFYNWLAAPGAKGPISDAAATQVVAYRVDGGDNDVKTAVVEAAEVDSETGAASVHNVTGYVDRPKEGRLDRYLDWVVWASGSQPVFVLILSGLVAWALAGIWYGETDSWAVIISDIQAILSYLFDSLLMRQQLNSYDQMIRLTASLRSRSATHRRLLRQLLLPPPSSSGGSDAPPTTPVPVPVPVPAAAVVDKGQLERRFRAKAASQVLPPEGWVGRASTRVASAMGHFVSILVFWAGIVVWIAFGPSLRWSDRWQLYINSATSALMVLIFCFLANIRERHTAYSKTWLDRLFGVDSAVEQKLRALARDAAPNEAVTVPGPRMGRLTRAIFYYADFVGTLTGVGILVAVMVAWVAIGPAMQFSANWWLLIGTYAGLIGLHDGFVLRNIQRRLGQYEDGAFDEADAADVALLAEIGVAGVSDGHGVADEEGEEEEARGRAAATTKQSFNTRVSERMGAIFAHEIAVVLDALLIVGLLIGASAMRWTVTGQLLCNVPPSIIETFIMLILITGHNLGEARRREMIYSMYLRRLKLLAYVEMLEEDAAEPAVVEKMVGVDA